MRIVLATPFFHPHVGGVESHVADIAGELAHRGHEVRVVTSRLPGTAPRERRRRVEIVRVPIAADLFTTPITPLLPHAIEETAADIVHSHSPPPLTAWYASMAAKRMRVPHVLTHHCDLEIPMLGGPAIVEIYRRTLERATIRGTTRIIATTKTYAATSRHIWGREVDVVPNPVDVERFNPENDGEEIRERLGLGGRPMALFVGRLTHHKGVEEFIRSAEYTGRDVVHVVVGDGPRRERYEALARNFPLGKVVFAGRVDWAELPQFYAASTVFCLPSVSRLEAFGIAALEAMASGKPIVVSQIPGVNELVEDGVTGLLSDPVNARDLAGKIERIVKDPEDANSMGKRARAMVVERFTTAAVADALETVYERAIADGVANAKDSRSRS
ncbi:MAG: glycosyltransferase family 4 protein [Thermoplasmatota archaeon]